MAAKKRIGMSGVSFSRIFLAFAILYMGRQVAYSEGIQIKSCEDVKGNSDFLSLADTRGSLAVEIPQLEEKLNKLQARIPYALPDEQLRAKRQRRDELVKAGSARKPDDDKELYQLQQELASATSKESIDEEMKKTTDDLQSKRELVLCITHRLSTIFTPEQNFKLWMSGAFAILIGFVIAGFYFLLSKDASIARAIFSGQGGIQFLTLFSIVIAIILFGITNILEGKELAALLGGLSGYILGKYNAGGGDGGGANGSTRPSFVEKLATISVEPQAVSLSPTSPSKQLTVAPKDSKGEALKDDNNVFHPRWVSSNADVAEVSESGLVTYKSAGNCTIAASFNGLTSNACAVTCA
jgi:hypothetical protein